MAWSCDCDGGTDMKIVDGREDLPEDPSIRRFSTRVVYENPWMRVREDRIQRRSGDFGIYGVVEKPDYALVIPVLDGGFVLVRQFRYPVEERYWEFPQGSWEHDPAAEPDAVASGELEEETGYRGAILRKLGFLYI